MKIKKESLSKAFSGARRGRPRTADILAIPKGALKQIKEIAAESKIPITTVFEDVVENGLLTVRSMYGSLITFRQNRAKLNETQPTSTVPEVAGDDIHQQNGDSHPEPDSDFLSEFEGEGTTEERSYADNVRAGLIQERAAAGLPIESDVL